MAASVIVRCALAACLAVAALACGAAPVRRLLVVNERGDTAALRLLDGLGAHLAGNGFGPEQVRIERRDVDAEAKTEQAAVRKLLAAERFDMVITSNMALAQIVKQVDGRVPIVFAGATDPVALCLAQSLLHPGMNATGLTSYQPMAAKMLEALRDAYPQLARWVVLVDGTRDEDDEEAEALCGAAAGAPAPARRAPGAPCISGPIARPQDALVDEVQSMVDYGHRQHLPLAFHRICTAADLAALAAYASAGRTVGIVVPFDYLFYLHRAEVVAAIDRARLPAIYPRTMFVQGGGLMSLSPVNVPEVRLFELVVQVLRGAAPGSLPIQAGGGFELWINVATARRLDLPPSLRAMTRAEHLIGD